MVVSSLAFSRESESIWSCRLVYRPSDNASEHDHNICSKFAGFPQTLQFGSTDKPHTAEEQDMVLALFGRKIYEIFNVFVRVIEVVHYTKYDIS